MTSGAAAGPSRVTTVTAVHTVGIPVTDQNRALDFYVGVLGFEQRLDAPLPQGGRWIEVAPAGSATSLALEVARPPVPAGGRTGVRLAAPDAAALHAQLRAGGVSVDELLAWPGVPPMFVLRDPDGNELTIIEAA